MKIVDAKGFSCPQPLIMTKQAIKEKAPEEALLVIVNNETSMKNVKRFLEDHQMVVRVTEKSGVFELHVGETTSIPESTIETDYCTIDSDSARPKQIVIVIQNNKMGSGADELGDILIKAFINTLPEVSLPSARIIFLNAGIHLACEGSAVLNSLQKLEAKGVKILCCGTCLDYYHKIEKLKVGTVSNMYEILELLIQADKVIYP
jgi:selenium metabolism protein YedF